MTLLLHVKSHLQEPNGLEYLKLFKDQMRSKIL